jgi:uncharacterized radical SAM superfamily protein
MHRDLPPSEDVAPYEVTDEADCLEIRRRNFDDVVRFHAPGFRRHKTSEYPGQKAEQFVTISITGNACALACDHCAMVKLKGMWDLRRHEVDLFGLCVKAKERGARGVLISGGCDSKGRVPLLKHIPDLIRVRRELDLLIRVHPGVVDEATAIGLGEVGIDGAMMDIIGDADTIREVYHLQSTPEDYEHSLGLLEKHGVPLVPHIVCGLHYGTLRGEWNALEIIARHPAKLVVLVVLTPLVGTPMADVPLPDLDELGAFFRHARRRLPDTPLMLGCARPLGPVKHEIDRHALQAGFNGLAYPADGSVAVARDLSLEPEFVDACCGVTW